MLMTLRKFLCAVALLTLFIHPSSRGDHPPDWLVSSASPERRLANLEVGSASIGDAVAVYGEPTSGGPIAGYSESEYVWELARSTITATTMHPPGRPRDEQIIYSIEVRQKPGRHSSVRTGANVGMGSTLETLLRAYGPRYLTSWRKLSKESATVSFVFENGTELSFGFSDQGRVQAISLTESQE